MGETVGDWSVAILSAGLIPLSQEAAAQLSTVNCELIEQRKPSGLVRGLFTAVCECVCELTQKKRRPHCLDLLGNFSMLEEQRRERKEERKTEKSD